MKDRTNPVARVFAILISILLVISGVLAIVIFNLFSQTFNPTVYKRAVVDARFYQTLPLLIGEQINHQVSQSPCAQDPSKCQTQGGQTSLSTLPPLSADQWSVVLTPLIDAAWAQKQVESVIDQVFLFINEPGRPLSINVSLVELKARLSGDEGYKAITQMIAFLKPCTGQELLSLPTSLLTGGSLPYCQPSEAIMKQAEEPLRQLLKVFSDALPDDTSALFGSMSQNLGTNLAVSLQKLQLIRTIAVVTPILPLFLLLLVTLLVVRSLKGFLRWWGIPMIITGVISLAIALSITPLAKVLVLDRFPLESLAPGLAAMIMDLSLNIVRSFESALVLQSTLLVLVGIIMVILAAVIKPKHKEEIPG